ncbi:MAG TPA: GvpL/GvpF family gas vesicle protein [Pyrinomonadaceae bacterium]|nr:GvpL/GvpF family gas vesicle protein [Pyrinomonadaceae bacterium]
MNLYAYCLSDDVAAGAVEDVAGVAGASPRLVERAGISAVVSECGDEKIAVTRENVMAHERVVRRVLAGTTPLPFRFGTIVTEARLASYLDSRQGTLKAQLERVRGAIEMSVKVIWKPVERGGGEDETAGEVAGGSGTKFLLKKRRELLGESARRERAEEVGGWLARAVEGFVRESRVELQPSENLILAASHLVERARLADYRAALGRAKMERPELQFLTSGAWPPYSFTSVGP